MQINRCRYRYIDNYNVYDMCAYILFIIYMYYLYIYIYHI